MNHHEKKWSWGFYCSRCRCSVCHFVEHMDISHTSLFPKRYISHLVLHRADSLFAYGLLISLQISLHFSWIILSVSCLCVRSPVINLIALGFYYYYFYLSTQILNYQPFVRIRHMLHKVIQYGSVGYTYQTVSCTIRSGSSNSSPL